MLLCVFLSSLSVSLSFTFPILYFSLCSLSPLSLSISVCHTLAHTHSPLPPSLPLPLGQILIQSVCETVVPKLVAEDIPLLHSLLTDVFPGVKYRSADVGKLKAEIAKVCAEMHLVCGDSDSTAAQWLEKVSSTYCATFSGWSLNQLRGWVIWCCMYVAGECVCV